MAATTDACTRKRTGASPGAGGHFRVRVQVEATGEVLDLVREEEIAFWEWAIVETLRHTGIRIEELLDLRALDIYGLSEVIGPGVAAECAEAADGLHVNEDHFIIEAVDPDSGEPVPDGTPGELVFSTVTKQALPLLRYRSGDIAALNREPCRCGRTAEDS